MVYIINGKPYILVSNYYKEVKVGYFKNQYDVKIVKDSERIYKNTISEKDIGQVTLEDFYNSKNKISDIIKK